MGWNYTSHVMQELGLDKTIPLLPTLSNYLKHTLNTYLRQTWLRLHKLCSHQKDYEAQRLSYTRENATTQSVQCLSAWGWEFNWCSCRTINMKATTDWWCTPRVKMCSAKNHSNKVLNSHFIWEGQSCRPDLQGWCGCGSAVSQQWALPHQEGGRSQRQHPEDRVCLSPAPEKFWMTVVPMGQSRNALRGTETLPPLRDVHKDSSTS